MIVEGVHFLADDPPGDVAWKLVAVNLSDLAAKGARPLGVLLGFSLAGEDEWDRAFVDGLRLALAAFDLALLGGDTVSVPKGAPRSEEHTSELQSLMRISYAVFCLKKKKSSHRKI